jgi:hypothetical protein
MINGQVLELVVGKDQDKKSPEAEIKEQEVKVVEGIQDLHPTIVVAVAMVMKKMMVAVEDEVVVAAEELEMMKKIMETRKIQTSKESKLELVGGMMTMATTTMILSSDLETMVTMVMIQAQEEVNHQLEEETMMTTVTKKMESHPQARARKEGEQEVALRNPERGVKETMKRLLAAKRSEEKEVVENKKMKKLRASQEVKSLSRRTKSMVRVVKRLEKTTLTPCQERKNVKSLTMPSTSSSFSWMIPMASEG